MIGAAAVIALIVVVVLVAISGPTDSDPDAPA